MGMVVVAFFAANADGDAVTTIRSTLRRTRSAASSGSRSFFLCKSVLDSDIFSLNPSKLVQLLPEPFQEDRDTRSSAWIQKTYPEEFPWLLRVDHGPTQGNAITKATATTHFRFRFRMSGGADMRFGPPNGRHNPHSTFDILFHLISLFARASTSGGIVRPICFAVFRLITNSNFVGCSTGRSAGLAPFSILST